jgi:hypothetical protein
MLRRFYNLDSAESAYFERQLEFVYAETYDIRYPDLMFRSFIPTQNKANKGATTVTYQQYDQVGRARIGSDMSDAPPRVDISGKEFTRPVRPVEDSYGWSLKDVHAAMYAGLDLNARRGSAARRAVEVELDEIAAIGAPKFGITTGALNETNTPIISSAGSWLTPATAAVIIGEVSSMYQAIIKDTKQTERPDTLALPTEQWAYVATTPRTDNTDTTILDFIKKNFPTLTAVEPWYRLDTAGASGVARAWMYPRRKDILLNEIPNEFEQLPVQTSGFQFIVNCYAYAAGVQVPYPLAMRYLDGI